MAQIELKKLRPLTWLETEILSKATLQPLQKKITDNRDRVVYELVVTEQSYVHSLLILFHVFKCPLKRYQKDLGLQEEHINCLFSNLEELLQIHTSLLETLIDCFKNWSPLTMLSEYLKPSVQQFNVYKTYSANYDKAVTIDAEYLRKKPTLKAFLQQLEEDPLCKGLSFPAFLIMPIQRIPRYVLLMNEILKYTKEDHPDYQGLMQVANDVKIAADNANFAPLEQEEISRTNKVISTLERYKELQIPSPGRVFLRKGNLSKVCHHGGLKTRKFFLFNNLFFYADRASSGKWNVCHMFPWETLSMVNDNSRENSFRIISGTSSFVVIAKDSEDKKEWLSCFSKVGLFERNVENTLLAPIWLPDTKECMLCLKKFTQIRRRHHCRSCGWVVCASCSDHVRYLEGQGRVKVCNNCVRDTDWEDFSSKDTDSVDRSTQYSPKDKYAKSSSTPNPKSNLAPRATVNSSSNSNNNKNEAPEPRTIKSNSKLFHSMSSLPPLDDATEKSETSISDITQTTNGYPTSLTLSRAVAPRKVPSSWSLPPVSSRAPSASILASSRSDRNSLLSKRGSQMTTSETQTPPSDYNSTNFLRRTASSKDNINTGGSGFVSRAPSSGSRFFTTRVGNHKVTMPTLAEFSDVEATKDTSEIDSFLENST